MALQKSPVDISFAQGIDQKIDPYRLPVGKFQSLYNSVFNKGGQLTKRNGYGLLASLPNSTSSYLTTFSNNLTAIGPTISAYNAGNQTWVFLARISSAARTAATKRWILSASLMPLRVPPPGASRSTPELTSTASDGQRGRSCKMPSFTFAGVSPPLKTR